MLHPDRNVHLRTVFFFLLAKEWFEKCWIWLQEGEPVALRRTQFPNERTCFSRAKSQVWAFNKSIMIDFDVQFLPVWLESIQLWNKPGRNEWNQREIESFLFQWRPSSHRLRVVCQNSLLSFTVASLVPVMVIRLDDKFHRCRIEILLKKMRN